MKNYAYYSNISFKTKILNWFRGIFISGPGEKLLLNKILASKNSSFWSRTIPSEYLYPKNSWRTYDRKGIKLKLDISNTVDHLKYFAFKDTGFENFISKLQSNFTILDIGANIGVTCLEMAKIAVGGKVIAFEPSISNFKRLEENIRLNTFKNIIAINTGIGDRPGEFNLYNVVDSNPGMKRILDAADAQSFESETIVIDTLENQLNQLNILEVSAIKIDVEGFEMKVLQSAACILEKYKPILFIELDDKNLRGQNSSALQLINYLAEFGYKIYHAEDILSGIGPDYNLKDCHFDIICE